MVLVNLAAAISVKSLPAPQTPTLIGCIFLMNPQEPRQIAGLRPAFLLFSCRLRCDERSLRLSHGFEEPVNFFALPEQLATP